MRMLYRFALLPGLLWASILSAQISDGGLPPSLTPETTHLFSATSDVPVISLPAPDLEAVRQEDAEQTEQGRFSAPLPVKGIDLNTHGKWTELPGGDRVWRCAVYSSQALGLILIFDAFKIPANARFYAYPAGKGRIFGAYTTRSCTPSGQFMIGILPGEKAVLEYYEPAAVKGQSVIHLNRVDYVYDPAGIAPADAPEDFGQSLGCNININCPQGQPWQTEKKGVARILMIFSNGAGWCTGTLIANTGNTGDPYFLSAHHCELIGLNPNFTLWRFDFDYEAPSCANPNDEPGAKSVLGCERIAFRAETDFMLLKLNPVPTDYGVYFNGWDRTTATNSLVPSSTFIHHPSGDIKKISIDNDPATIHTQSINWGGVFGTSPANSHWRIIPDDGIYQPGSSGCPLFNPSKRIVGQLHGGNADQQNPCIILSSYFGRFDLSWNQGTTADARLKDWLDPGNTGAVTQNGYPQPIPTTFSIAGNIQTHWGTPMNNVTVNLTGDAVASTHTDAGGNFSFAGLNGGLSYTVTPRRDTNDVNGLSTFDLSLINKHVLGLDTLDSPWKILAADTNKSNSVSTIDIVEGRKVLLGLNPAFPANDAWRFFPALTNFPNPINPFTGFPGGPPAEFLKFDSLQQNVLDANFKGIKVGDANNNAQAGG